MSRRFPSRLFVSLATAATIWCGTSSARAQDLENRIVERLQSLVFAPPDRARTELLAALRQLKDPALRPLFAQLAASDYPDLRRQGMLGLADLDDPPRLNTIMLAGLKDPVEQARVLGEAVREELVSIEQMQDMLAWPNLDPYLALVLRGRLAAAGRTPDVTGLESLALSESSNVSVIARVLLAQAGVNATIEPAFETIMKIERPRRDALVAFLTEHFRREKLTAASGLVARLLQEYPDDRHMRIDLIRTQLALAPKEGAASWKAAYASASDLSMRLRFALIAMENAGALDADVFTTLQRDASEPLLGTIGAAGAAIASGSGVTEAFSRLVASGYDAGSVWVVVHVKELDPRGAPVVWKGLIEWAAAQTPMPDQSFDSVARSAEQLASVDAPWLAAAIDRACKARNRKLSRALLTGVLRGAGRPVWDPAAPPDWPDPTSESLALVVEARADEQFGKDPARLDRLRQIALGVTDVPDRVRVMASWLAIERGGQPEKALARILTAPK